MTEFDTPVLLKPKYKVQIFNMSYSWEDAYGNISANADPYKSGWYDVPQESPYVGIERLKISNTIREKSTCEIDILDDEYWLYTCDMIVKRESTVEAPWTVLTQPVYSKLIIQIDTDGYNSPDTVGTVDIVGELDSVSLSESVSINGEGSYVSEYTYDTITSIDVTDLSCHVSVFANTGKSTAKREIRVLCDTNGDGHYGLMFGGYLTLSKKRVNREYHLYTLKCVDYTDYFMSNEHVCGYRTDHRCSYYSQTGASGSCSNSTWSSLRFHTLSFNNKRCYLGDMDVRHPDGTQVDPDYTCGGYEAGSERLPYDGYTYDKTYSPESDPKYSYHPPDYTRVLYALKRYANSIDSSVRSRDFDLHMKGMALVNESLTDTDTEVSFDNLVGNIQVNDFVLIDNEWMLVSSNFDGTLTVTRGSLGSLAVAHADNSVIKCYTFANTKYASNSHDFLVEPDTGGTLKNTGDNLAKILTSRITNSDYVFWIDFYKQLHMTEMYRPDTGYSGSLTLTSDIISNVSNIKVGEVVNKVSCWVKNPSGIRFYLEMDTSNLTGYTKSIDLFGLQSKEVKNDQLNSLGYDDLDNNLFGFKTFAEAYLKVHAYPRITQTVTVDSFVPDEHYWTNDYKPLLTYNDPVNSYICLLGTRITCPDFSIEGHPNKTFVIEGLRYDIRECGNFPTDIIMSRMSEESDYI